MAGPLTTPRPNHGALNWDTQLETDLGNINTALFDTGWITTGLTAAAGFTITSQRYRRIGNVVTVGVVLTRTGAAITANTSGMLAANTPVATLPASLQPAFANGNVGNANSTVAVGGYVSSSGTINVTTGPPSVGIPVSATLDLVVTYLL